MSDNTKDGLPLSPPPTSTPSRLTSSARKVTRANCLNALTVWLLQYYYEEAPRNRSHVYEAYEEYCTLMGASIVEHDLYLLIVSLWVQIVLGERMPDSQYELLPVSTRCAVDDATSPPLKRRAVSIADPSHKSTNYGVLVYARLVDAVCWSAVSLLRGLLDEYPRILHADGGRNTIALLDFALSQYNVPVAELLVEYGAPLSYGLLSAAASAGSMKILRDILRAPLPCTSTQQPNARAQLINNALVVAGECGGIDAMTYLLNAGADAMQSCEPLAAVASNKRQATDEVKAMARLLFERGATVDAPERTIDGTVLRYACEHRISLVPLLVEAGARPGLRARPALESLRDEVVSALARGCVEVGHDDDDEAWLAAIAALSRFCDTDEFVPSFIVSYQRLSLDASVRCAPFAVVQRRLQRLLELYVEHGHADETVRSSRRETALTTALVRKLEYLRADESEVVEGVQLRTHLTRLLLRWGADPNCWLSVASIDALLSSAMCKRDFEVLVAWGADRARFLPFSLVNDSHTRMFRLATRERSLLSALSSVRRVMMVARHFGVVDDYMTSLLSLHLWHADHCLLSRESRLDVIYPVHERSKCERWLLSWEDMSMVVRWCRAQIGDTALVRCGVTQTAFLNDILPNRASTLTIAPNLPRFFM